MMKANLSLVYNDGYWPEEKAINDRELSILWEFTREIPINKPSWLINELKQESIGGMNVIEFDYEDSDVIISSQFNAYGEGGEYIRIEKNKLFELILKYACLASKKVQAISLVRINGEYIVHEG